MTTQRVQKATEPTSPNPTRWNSHPHHFNLHHPQAPASVKIPLSPFAGFNSCEKGGMVRSLPSRPLFYFVRGSLGSPGAPTKKDAGVDQGWMEASLGCRRELYICGPPFAQRGQAVGSFSPLLLFRRSQVPIFRRPSGLRTGDLVVSSEGNSSCPLSTGILGSLVGGVSKRGACAVIALWLSSFFFSFWRKEKGAVDTLLRENPSGSLSPAKARWQRWQIS